MSARTSILGWGLGSGLIIALCASIAGCGSSSNSSAPSDGGGDALADGVATTDAVSTGDAGDAAIRTLVHNPLFGDTVPQNLFIDPNFSVREPGLGDWEAQTADTTQSGPTYTSLLMSDSPDGIALNVGELADATASTASAELSLLAQVPGGPGPYTLHVWVSTLDATQSATLTGVTIALLTSYDATAIAVTEDPTQKKTIAGRTWHLYDGSIAQNLTLGGFIELDFAASKNTWLLQGPEFVPTGLSASPPLMKVPMHHPAAQPPRALNAHERKIIEHYTHKPRLSVPPARLDKDRPRDRR